MRRAIRGRLVSVLLALILALACITPAAAVIQTATVVIHGRPVSFFTAACLAGDSTYVPLEEFVQALDGSARYTWNERRCHATVTLKGLTLEVTQGDSYLVANGRYLYLESRACCWDGQLMLPAEPLAKALGVTLQWDGEARTLSVSGEVQPIAWREYDENELYWLSHIIYAEAGTESLEGMIAVGNVVLNRVRNTYWSDDIYEVIFDTSCGVQFSPTIDGSVYREPSEMAVIAAKLAMEGADVVGNSLFFMNPSISSSSWFDRNCLFVTTVGSHSFYTAELYFDGFPEE